jgi:2-keto-myo-inositol isomerase
LRFAINHIVAPSMPVDEFFALAKSVGIDEVEIRNDLAGAPIADGTTAAEVRDAAARAEVTILTINALYPFNQWTPDLETEAVALADYASACGAEALVMCPLNDGTPVALDGVVDALAKAAPILQDHGLRGFVEPLGFRISSLRTKAEAVRAIEESGTTDTYRLVHDTFHHHLAGEADLYPDWTGIVHISGVVDPELAVEHMLDDHRILVDDNDRLGTVSQISKLLAAGFNGPYSFEPFAREVQVMSDPATALRASIDCIRSRVAERHA